MKHYLAILVLPVTLLCSCSQYKSNKGSISGELFFQRMDTLSIDTSKGISVADSLILRMYLAGEFKEIVDGNFNINTQLKRGLYSASLSNLSRYKEARRYLSNVEKIGVELNEDN